MCFLLSLSIFDQHRYNLIEISYFFKVLSDYEIIYQIFVLN